MEKDSYFGFLGCFGIGKGMRRVLGKTDTAIDRFLPSSWKYIGAFTYRKVK